MTTRKSETMTLLEHIWEHVPRDSWARLNSIMQDALGLAMKAGLSFAESDFAAFEERFRFHRWGGQDGGGFAERWYSCAIVTDNLSAARSFEHWKKRPPFIFDRIVRYDRYESRRGPHAHGRLAVGFSFRWGGETIWVTSFSQDGAALVACDYGPDDGQGGRRKVTRRIKITLADLRADMKSRRQAKPKAKEEVLQRN